MENVVKTYLEDISKICNEKQKTTFEKAITNLQQKEVVKMETLFSPKEIERIKKLKIEKKLCYHNSWKIATSFSDVKYVEGFATMLGNLVFEHAWNEKNGKWFDATEELALGWSVNDNYSSVLILDGRQTLDFGVVVGHSGPYFNLYLPEPKIKENLRIKQKQL